jgi:hypothetical protein
VPVRFRDKAPIGEKWQELRLTAEELPGVFGNGPVNVGLLLGEPYNLTDVDLDSREALWAWWEFQIETGTIWGRRSKPASHFLYRSDEAVRTIRYTDPCAAEDEKACLLELRSYKSDGKPGLQTVMPPSIHPSGEEIEFLRGMALTPANVDHLELKLATDWTAAACLLGRYAPAEGKRHDYFLAIAGMLAHGKAEIENARRLIRSLYRMFWGERANIAKAEAEAESTYQRYDDGHEITGIPHLEKVLKPEVLDQALKWLGLGRAKTKTAIPKKARTAKIYSMSELEALDLEEHHEQLIEGILTLHGVMLLCGAPKIGKTILGADAAIAVATGKALFNNYRVLRPGPTLIVENDDPDAESSIRKILRAAKVAHNVPLYVCERPPSRPDPNDPVKQFQLDDEMMEWLKARIQELKLVFIVLDSYTALRTSHAGVRDIVKRESSDVTMVDELGKKNHCSILLIHHPSKGAAALDWSSKAAGTFAMTAAAEGQILIERYKGIGLDAPERHVRLQARHFSGLEMTLRFEKESMGYELILEGTAAEHYPMILQIQAEFGSTPFDAKGLQAVLGVKQSQVYRHIRMLIEADVLTKNAHGAYQLNLAKGRKPNP